MHLNATNYIRILNIHGRIYHMAGVQNHLLRHNQDRFLRQDIYGGDNIASTKMARRSCCVIETERNTRGPEKDVTTLT